MGTVYDIPDTRLMESAVRNARSRVHRKGLKHYRWVAVMDLFGLGSNYAKSLCVRFNLDPDEMVAR